MSGPIAPRTAYREVLEGLKTRVRSAHLAAAVAANRELILLYWDIGRTILDRQAEAGWGGQIVDKLARDLRAAFPTMKGFSPRNLKYMRAFAAAWPDREIVQQVVAQIGWSQHVILLDKVASPTERLFYVRLAAERGWSRNVLSREIGSGLHLRQGQAVTNFERTLALPEAQVATRALKDPYLFDFLQLDDSAIEREVEQALVDHVRKFLLELGVGFAFVGNQVRLEVGGDEFYIDLLFYHLKLRCFVVVELKNRPFQPADAGQLNFYLSVIDDQQRHPSDQPSIGLLLCRARNKVVVEYALRDMAKPIGVAEWQTKLVESLPAELLGSLPTIADLEAELGDSEPADDG